MTTHDIQERARYDVYGLIAELAGSENDFTYCYPAAIVNREIMIVSRPDWTLENLKKLRPGEEQYLSVVPEELTVTEGEIVVLAGSDFLNSLILLTGQQPEVEQHVINIAHWLQYRTFHAAPMTYDTYLSICAEIEESAAQIMDRFNNNPDVDNNEVVKAADHILAVFPGAETKKAYALRKKYYKKIGDKRSVDFITYSEKLFSKENS